MSKRTLALELLTVAGFCAFLFFFGLGAFGLTGADEPRYAQIAREMLARHDWVTPVLYGQPWLEKPILYYWEAMLAYKFFGSSDWVARLPSAFSATVMVFAIYAFARRFLATVAIDAALITAATAAFIGFSHAASMDMPLTACFTIGMMCWFCWYATVLPREPGLKQERAWLLGFYLFMALGTLAKGPVAPGLAALVIVIFVLLPFRDLRDARIIWRTLWWPGVLLFLAVVLPWYIAVQRANPGFASEFFFLHNLERFSTDLYRHKQPFWYYVPVLIAALAPWTVYALSAYVSSIRALRPRYGSAPAADTPVRTSSGSEAAKAPSQAVSFLRGTLHHLPLAQQRQFAAIVALSPFLLVWGAVPIIFFSISRSKLPGYILPAIPAWTLLLAYYIARRAAEEPKPRPWRVLAHAAVAAAALGAVLELPYRLMHVAVPERVMDVAAAVTLVLLIGIALSILQNGLRALRFVTLVPVVIAMAYLVRVDGPALDPKISTRLLAHEIQRIAPASAPVAVFHVTRQIEYGLGFYFDREIPNYDRGEHITGDHLVVAPLGSEQALAGEVHGRRVLHVGSFSPQKLELFWISSAPQEHVHSR